MGNFISGTFVKFFDFYGGIAIMIALFAISLLIIFEAKLSLDSFMFWRKYRDESICKVVQHSDGVGIGRRADVTRLRGPGAVRRRRPLQGLRHFGPPAEYFRFSGRSVRYLGALLCSPAWRTTLASLSSASAAFARSE